MTHFDVTKILLLNRFRLCWYRNTIFDVSKDWKITMSPGNVSGMFLEVVFVWISMCAKNSMLEVPTSKDLNFLNGERLVEGRSINHTVLYRFSMIMDHNCSVFRWKRSRLVPGKRISARMNFGTRTSANDIDFGTRILHGAEFNIWCRSLQLSAEVTRAEHR